MEGRVQRATSPCVTVVTPCFNAIGFIDACVDQVAAQGAVVLEHVIVDGGSTDGTAERIAELAELHPKIRFMPGPDKGQSDALNKGTAAARAPFISLLNVDDYYEPGALAEMAGYLKREAGPAMVVGNCRVVDQHGATLYMNCPSDLRVEALLLGWDVTPHPVNPAAYLYHREVHHLVGGFPQDEHYVMDLHFIYSAAARVTMRYVDRTWGNFRLMPGTKTFDDVAGKERATSLRRRHIAYLTRRQRLKLPILRLRIKASRAKWRLRRAWDRVSTDY